MSNSLGSFLDPFATLALSSASFPALLPEPSTWSLRRSRAITQAVATLTIPAVNNIAARVRPSPPLGSPPTSAAFGAIAQCGSTAVRR
mmetsp:Transcript_90798/g.111157  ORF Transcript_90798/g.111157 Transcript_90798/m.111157 type:complete len:88 (-) Transcript_90798:21-284(-)